MSTQNQALEAFEKFYSNLMHYDGQLRLYVFPRGGVQLEGPAKTFSSGDTLATVRGEVNQNGIRKFLSFDPEAEQELIPVPEQGEKGNPQDWWSILGIQLQSHDKALKQLMILQERFDNVFPAFGIWETAPEIQEAFLEIRAQTKGLSSWAQAYSPPILDPTRSILLYAPSSAPGAAGALWANAPKGSRTQEGLEIEL